MHFVTASPHPRFYLCSSRIQIWLSLFIPSEAPQGLSGRTSDHSAARTSGRSSQRKGLWSCPHFKDGRFISHRQFQLPSGELAQKAGSIAGLCVSRWVSGLCPRLFSCGLRRRKKRGQSPGRWEARALLLSSGSGPGQDVATWVTEWASGLRCAGSQNATSLFFRAPSGLHYYS